MNTRISECWVHHFLQCRQAAHCPTDQNALHSRLSYCSPISPSWTPLPETNIYFQYTHTQHTHEHTHTLSHQPAIWKLSQNFYLFIYFLEKERLSGNVGNTHIPMIIKQVYLLYIQQSTPIHICAHKHYIHITTTSCYVYSNYLLPCAGICSASSVSVTFNILFYSCCINTTYHRSIDLCWFMVILWHVVMLAYSQYALFSIC